MPPEDLPNVRLGITIAIRPMGAAANEAEHLFSEELIVEHDWEAALPPYLVEVPSPGDGWSASLPTPASSIGSRIESAIESLDVGGRDDGMTSDPDAPRVELVSLDDLIACAPTKRIARRFSTCVDADGADGCWVWTAAHAHNGYGVITHNRKQRRLHRFVFELVKGPIPQGLVVAHWCDNRPCVNPAHLEAMTQRENLLHMVRRGRARTKLDDDQVREIRRRYALGESMRSLEKDFPVTRSTIHLVVQRRRYSHVV